jgi:hypothetical protein
MGQTKWSQRVLAAVLLFGAASAVSNPLVGSFTGYSGPVGDFYNAVGDVPQPNDSTFRLGNGTDTSTLVLDPTTIVPGTVHVGTTSHDFTEVLDPTSVAFWNAAEDTLATANVLQFTPAAAIAPVPFVPFILGTLSFDNHSWFSSEPQVDFGTGPLYAVSVFHFDAAVSGLSGAEWVDDLVYVSTRGAGTNDRFYFAGHPGMGTFVAPEGVISSVDILAEIGSLDPIAFVNPQGGASIIPAAVPEPSPLLLLAIAVLPLMGRRRAAGTSRPRRNDAGLVDAHR